MTPATDPKQGKIEKEIRPPWGPWARGPIFGDFRGNSGPVSDYRGNFRAGVGIFGGAKNRPPPELRRHIFKGPTLPDAKDSIVIKHFFRGSMNFVFT